MQSKGGYDHKCSKTETVIDGIDLTKLNNSENSARTSQNSEETKPMMTEPNRTEDNQL